MMSQKPQQKRNRETDEEDASASGSEIQQKRKKRYYQKWRKEYSSEYPDLSESSKFGPTHAFCRVCHQDFSITHGGKFDCERHVESTLHKNSEKLASSKKISSFFVKPAEQSTTSLTIRAEALLCQMIAEHNLPLSSADYFTAMFREMFPDSKIAANMQCCRSKATAIVKEMSAMSMKSLAQKMRVQPWSLATDGSNDKDKKQYPLVVTIEGEDGLVTPQLLALPNCESFSTGENIFEVVNRELAAQNVSWDNCVAMGSDNAPVMTGVHKGVIAFVREKRPSVHLARCCLHLVHIAAKKGASCLPPVEDILTDIFYYLQRSVNRQTELKALQELYDVEQCKIIKHVCTRWLSIKRCLERLIDNWEPLLHFFHQESKTESGQRKNSKVQHVYDFLRSPTNKLYCLFLKYTLKVYDKVLVGLQKEEPMIHKLRPSLSELLSDLFNRFVLPSEAGKLDVKQFQLKGNQKADSDILIGSEAMGMIADPKKYKLRDEKIAEFYKAIRIYFSTVCDYLLKNLPLDDQVLINSAVVNLHQRKNLTTSHLNYFLNRFPMLMGGADRDDILEEFAKYQSADLDVPSDERVDHSWTKLSSEYPQLSRIMRGILTIPHSSAPCERIFSMVRKTCTDQRQSLHSDTTEALLVVKTKPPKKLSESELQQLKGSYYQSLKK